jgi:hypothetical protein
MAFAYRVMPGFSAIGAENPDDGKNATLVDWQRSFLVATSTCPPLCAILCGEFFQAEF